MTVADRLDELTHTFEKDRAYCESLFASQNAEAAAELLVSHQWANSAFVICQKLLCGQAASHFGQDGHDKGERGALWALVLSESMHRDMRLVAYLAFRGLVWESAVLLRRAFEHAGVLMHLWRDPRKLDAFEDPRGKQYTAAFRREADHRIAELPKEEGSSKRFAAMTAGQSATVLYDRLSEFLVHGRTPTRIAFMSLDPGPASCTFAFRGDPRDTRVGQELELLRQGHQLLCCEIVCLCLNYCPQIDEFVEAARILPSLSQTGPTRTPEMAAAVNHLLRLFREGSSGVA